MRRSQSKSYNISDFYEWYQKKQLVLQPKFQRRSAWSKRAKSYLIDTILRGLPIPKLYIRQIIDLSRGISLREVVDGQQRLTAVFEFIRGETKVSEIHNKEYCDLKFEELPEEVRKDFLAYEFSVGLLLGASDREVLDIFKRINSYGLVLNAQEKLNAEFFGAFRQTIYTLGLDHLEFWRRNLILKDRKISRMAEAQLTSELVVAMLDGLQQGKKPLRQFYKRYDEKFPEAEKAAERFHDIINLISFVFGDKLSKTPFKRSPLFYSLFCVFYDCKYGLPKMDMGRVPINEKTRSSVLEALVELGKEITAEEIKPQYDKFVLACRRSTDKLNERKIRHRFIWNAIQSTVLQTKLK